jgi:hypothetical protein
LIWRELALRRELNESKMVTARLTDELEDKSKAIQNKEKELQESKGAKIYSQAAFKTRGSSYFKTGQSPRLYFLKLQVCSEVKIMCL